ncbi:unnamed protein product [Meganyctiphanes norvegica]|uniref:Uncharacterized protein n=1 Tax=Meganyctiphanes norvegica TaxID=48144 RepID=A0AAV2RD10_MEGNR
MLSAAKILAFMCVVGGAVGDASLLDHHSVGHGHHGAHHGAEHHGAHHDVGHHGVHHDVGHHDVGHHGVHHNDGHHAGHHGVGHHSSPAQYGFDYAVHDDYSGNQFGHSETRDGYKVEGTYYVHLPDGRVQTVNYYADETGYHPTVVYEGTATYHQGGSHHAEPHY